MCSSLTLDGFAEVVWSEVIEGRIGSLRVSNPEIARKAEPGQFCMLFAGEDWGLPLGRPLGIAGVEGDVLHFLFEIIGKGTQWFSELYSGAKLRIRGPLGTPFPEPVGEKLWLAGGTLGIAPLLFAYQRKSVDSQLLLGVPDASWGSFSDWIDAEFPGLITLSPASAEASNPVEYLLAHAQENDEVWACGPDGMMKAVGVGLTPSVKRAMVSLESVMGCGYGGCLGCSVHLKTGPVLVCKDGPFFNAAEVNWDV